MRSGRQVDTGPSRRRRGRRPDPVVRSFFDALSIAHALDQLAQLKAVEHTWEEQAIVVQATRPDRFTERILSALGIRLASPVVRVTKTAVA